MSDPTLQERLRGWLTGNWRETAMGGAYGLIREATDALDKAEERLAPADRLAESVEREREQLDEDHGHGGDGESCRYCDVGHALSAFRESEKQK